MLALFYIFLTKTNHAYSDSQQGTPKGVLQQVRGKIVE